MGPPRRQHPVVGRNISLQELSKFPRIMVKMPDRSLTEFYRSVIELLEERLNWPIFFETESMLSALSIIRNADYLIPVPDFVAKYLAASSDVSEFAIAEFPKNLYNYVTVSHKRVSDSAMHHWFRSVLMEIGREITTENERPYA